MSTKKSTKKIRGVFEKVKGSGIWWIQYFDATGRRRREKAGHRSDAVTLINKRRTEKLQRKKLPESFRTPEVAFRDIAKAALEYYRQENRSYRHAEFRMAPLVKQFGDRQAESILPEEFESWLGAKATERKWAPATGNRYIALIKLAYRLAEKNRKIKANPARLLRMRKENNARIRYLNQHQPLPTETDYLKGCKDEETRLRAVITAEYAYHRPEFEIALHTGMRHSEQYSLTWPDIDWEGRLLKIRHSKHGDARYVPLNSIVVAMLQFLQARAEGADHVFLSVRGGNPLLGNRHWFEDAVKNAGIAHFTWHDLRHTFASRLAKRGIDLRKIQELMGHRTIQMTCRYAHIEQRDLLAAVETLTSEPSAALSATASTTTKSKSAASVN